MTNRTATARPANSAAVREAAKGSPVAVTHAEGEYRITYRQNALAESNPQLTTAKQLHTLAESKAQYCTDHAEALEAVRHMIANAARWTLCNDTHPDAQRQPETAGSQPAPDADDCLPIPIRPASQSAVMAARSLARELAMTPAEVEAAKAASPYNDTRPYADQLASLLVLIDGMMFGA